MLTYSYQLQVSRAFTPLTVYDPALTARARVSVSLLYLYSEYVLTGSLPGEYVLNGVPRKKKSMLG